MIRQTWFRSVYRPYVYLSPQPFVRVRARLAGFLHRTVLSVSVLLMLAVGGGAAARSLPQSRQARSVGGTLSLHLVGRAGAHRFDVWERVTAYRINPFEWGSRLSRFDVQVDGVMWPVRRRLWYGLRNVDLNLQIPRARLSDDARILTVEMMRRQLDAVEWRLARNGRHVTVTSKRLPDAMFTNTRAIRPGLRWREPGQSLTAAMRLRLWGIVAVRRFAVTVGVTQPGWGRLDTNGSPTLSFKGSSWMSRMCQLDVTLDGHSWHVSRALREDREDLAVDPGEWLDFAVGRDFPAYLSGNGHTLTLRLSGYQVAVG